MSEASQGTAIAYDWYDGRIPPNVVVGEDVYIDSAYGFAPFLSERSVGLVLGDASGAYDRATFVVGPRGQVTVGAFTVLNGTFIICEERVEIGAHGLLSWGVVITDIALGAPAPLDARREALRAAAADPNRRLPPVLPPRPVVIEDNVWIGFDAVVGPGVRVGQGAIIGCKTVIHDDVPPYAVVVGDPSRVVRTLDPADTPEARRKAFAEYGRRTAHGNVR